MPYPRRKRPLRVPRKKKKVGYDNEFQKAVQQYGFVPTSKLIKLRDARAQARESGDKALLRSLPSRIDPRRMRMLPKQEPSLEEKFPLTKQLVAVSVSVRNKAVRKLSEYLKKIKAGPLDASQRDSLRMQMAQIWKALFYNFWMSDKPIFQQDLAIKLANMTVVCGDVECTLIYLECFWQCMHREWTGIDFIRRDKFLSLVRHFTHSMLDFAAVHCWDLEICSRIAYMLRHYVLLNNVCAVLDEEALVLASDLNSNNIGGITQTGTDTFDFEKSADQSAITTDASSSPSNDEAERTDESSVFGDRDIKSEHRADMEKQIESVIRNKVTKLRKEIRTLTRQRSILTTQNSTKKARRLRSEEMRKIKANGLTDVTLAVSKIDDRIDDAKRELKNAREHLKNQMYDTLDTFSAVKLRMSSTSVRGLALHVCDVFMTELVKVNSVKAIHYLAQTVLQPLVNSLTDKTWEYSGEFFNVPKVPSNDQIFGRVNPEIVAFKPQKKKSSEKSDRDVTMDVKDPSNKHQIQTDIDGERDETDETNKDDENSEEESEEEMDPKISRSHARYRPVISFDALYQLLSPFVAVVIESTDRNYSAHVLRTVFIQLLDSMNARMYKAIDRVSQVMGPGKKNLEMHGIFHPAVDDRSVFASTDPDTLHMKIEDRKQKRKQLNDFLASDVDSDASEDEERGDELGDSFMADTPEELMAARRKAYEEKQRAKEQRRAKMKEDERMSTPRDLFAAGGDISDDDGGDPLIRSDDSDYEQHQQLAFMEEHRLKKEKSDRNEGNMEDIDMLDEDWDDSDSDNDLVPQWKDKEDKLQTKLNSYKFIKNYEVTMPESEYIKMEFIFKHLSDELLTLLNQHRLDEIENGIMKARECDPLLLRDKLIQFAKVLRTIGNHSMTPLKYRHKLVALSYVFQPVISEEYADYLQTIDPRKERKRLKIGDRLNDINEDYLPPMQRLKQIKNKREQREREREEGMAMVDEDSETSEYDSELEGLEPAEEVDLSQVQKQHFDLSAHKTALLSVIGLVNNGQLSVDLGVLRKRRKRKSFEQLRHNAKRKRRIAQLMQAKMEADEKNAGSVSQMTMDEVRTNRLAMTLAREQHDPMFAAVNPDDQVANE